MSRWLWRAVYFFLLLVIGCWLFGESTIGSLRSEKNSNTIRFSHFGDFQDYALWREILAEFERLHPDLSVRQEYVTGLAGHYNTKLRQQIVSGTMTDVAMIQLGPFHELAENFADVTKLVSRYESGQDGFDPTALAAFTSDGVTRGVPISGGNLLIYCNPVCFERAERFHGRAVPLPTGDWNLEDFQRLAKELTCDFDGDGRMDQFGFWHPRWIYYLPFLWSFGAELADADAKRWRLLGAHAERAVVFYRDLVHADHVCPRPAEVPQLFQDVGFLTGRAAMCVNGPWFQPFLESTRLKDGYVVVHIPMGPGGRATRVTWDGVVVRRDLSGERRELALQFVEFLLSAEVQRRIGKSGRAIPARLDSWDGFLGTPPDTRRRVFVEAMEYSRLQPLLRRFGEVDRVIQDRLARFLDSTSQQNAAEFLENLANDKVIRSVFSVAEAS